ncbi:hypothetical protein D9M72_532300 [compost metagenome]
MRQYGVHHIRHRGRIREGAGAHELADERLQERLLVADPLEVAIGKGVALADELQGLRAGDMVDSGREVMAGVRA